MLSVTMLTKDSEALIGHALESVSWCDDVIILDNGSTDHTLEIAATFPNVRIHQTTFSGFGSLRNEAARLAKHDWIFPLDSDEIVSHPLAEELKQLSFDPSCVYAIPRHNYFQGKWIRWCGWHPDRPIRIYHRKHTSYVSTEQIHEKVGIKGMTLVRLKGWLDHTPYASLRDFIDKMQLYSDLFAAQHAGTRCAPLIRCIWKGFFAFFRSYFIWRGILGGYQGFVISVFNSQITYWKYLKLREANQKRAQHRYER